MWGHLLAVFRQISVSAGLQGFPPTPEPSLSRAAAIKNGNEPRGRPPAVPAGARARGTERGERKKKIQKHETDVRSGDTLLPVGARFRRKSANNSSNKPESPLFPWFALSRGRDLAESLAELSRAARDERNGVTIGGRIRLARKEPASGEKRRTGANGERKEKRGVGGEGRRGEKKMIDRR